MRDREIAKLDKMIETDSTSLFNHTAEDKKSLKLGLAEGSLLVKGLSFLLHWKEFNVKDRKKSVNQVSVC